MKTAIHPWQLLPFDYRSGSQTIETSVAHVSARSERFSALQCALRTQNRELLNSVEKEKYQCAEYLRRVEDRRSL